MQHGVTSQGADGEGYEDGQEVLVDLLVETRDEDDADEGRKADDDDANCTVAVLCSVQTNHFSQWTSEWE